MYLIGIAGGSGSGKTTFARKVLAYAQEIIQGWWEARGGFLNAPYPLRGEQQVLPSRSTEGVYSGVGILHQDSYYVASAPERLRTATGYNFDHPEAFDWGLLQEHLSLLKNGSSVPVPTYDYHTNSRRPEVENLGPCHTVIMEGIYALWDPAVRDLFDVKVYLNVDADIRFIRRLHRDVKDRGRTLDSIVSQYYDTVRPMHHEFLEPTRQYANLIVGEETDVAARVLAAQVAEMAIRAAQTTSQLSGILPAQVSQIQRGIVA